MNLLERKELSRQAGVTLYTMSDFEAMEREGLAILPAVGEPGTNDFLESAVDTASFLHRQATLIETPRHLRAEDCVLSVGKSAIARYGHPLVIIDAGKSSKSNRSEETAKVGLARLIDENTDNAVVFGVLHNPEDSQPTQIVRTERIAMLMKARGLPLARIASRRSELDLVLPAVQRIKEATPGHIAYLSMYKPPSAQAT